ncbi:MAG: hypothetical protein VR70_10785 [Rhodospirillaceae bacterium BRH_c57]|nr:MAG: hypothetical protein VR70_10785 [Rhodospirillaceae bacterium BRH_c57]
MTKLEGTFKAGGCTFRIEALEVFPFGSDYVQMTSDSALQAEHDALAEIFCPAGDFRTVSLAGRDYAVFVRPMGVHDD